MAIHFRATSYRAPQYSRREGAQPDRWTPLEAPIADAYVQAVEAHTAKLDMEAIRAAVVERNLPDIVRLLQFDALDTRLQMTMTAPILSAFEAGEDYGRSKLPGITARKLSIVKAEASGTAYDFGVTNEAAMVYAQEHIGDLITHISSTQLDTIRNIIGTQGFAAGEPIDALAKMISGTVGLNAPQSLALQKYAQAQWGNTFEGNPKMSPMVQKKIDATQGRIDRYEQRLLRERGDMIARTEVIRAENQGQLQLWKEGQAAGYVAKDANKVWIATMGACEICVELAGTIIPIADDYNGIGGDGPPAHPNCRCDLALAPVGAKQTGAGAGATAAEHPEDNPEAVAQAEADAQAVAQAAEPTQQDNLERLYARGLITTEERDIAQVFLNRGMMPELLGGHNTFAYVTEINPDTGKWILRNIVTLEPRASGTKGIYTYATEKAALADAGRQKFTVGTVDKGGLFVGDHLTPLAKGPINFEKLTLSDVRGWTPIDGPKGYNPGQWYQDPLSDRIVFLKQVASPDAAFNEVSVAKTYEALGAKPGIDIPDVRAFTDLGNGYVLSEKMTDLTQYDKSVWTGEGRAPQELRDMAQKFWAGDVLTSNWDVVGNNPLKGYDNLLARTTPDGKEVTNVVRIDLGGGGRFRGVGSLKENFVPAGDWADPWTMRGQTRNAQSGSEQGKAVFGSITDKEAQKLLKQMATRLNETRLTALDTSLAKAGVTNYARSAYMDVIRARVEQVPQVVEMLKPERPLAALKSGQAFKVPEGQTFPNVGGNFKSEAENIAAGNRVVNINTIRDIKGNPKFFDSRDQTDIVTYMTSGSNDTNKYMRQDPTRRISEDPKYKARTEMLDQVFQVSRATDYFTVHTGQDQYDSQKAWKENTPWKNDNSWSTSIGSDGAFHQVVTVHIEVPKGAPIIWAMPVSRYASEREMITPRGMVLVFSKIIRDSLGQPKEVWARYVSYAPDPLGKGPTDRGPVQQASKFDITSDKSLAQQTAAKLPDSGSISDGFGGKSGLTDYFDHIPSATEILDQYSTGGDLSAAQVKEITGYSPTALEKWVNASPEKAGEPLWEKGGLTDSSTINVKATAPTAYVEQAAKLTSDEKAKYEAIFGHPPTTADLAEGVKAGTITAADEIKITGYTATKSYVDQFPEKAAFPLWKPAHVTEFKAILANADLVSADYKAILEKEFGHVPTPTDLISAFYGGDHPMSPDSIKELTGYSNPADLAKWVSDHGTAAQTPLWEEVPKELTYDQVKALADSQGFAATADAIGAVPGAPAAGDYYQMKEFIKDTNMTPELAQQLYNSTEGGGYKPEQLQALKDVFPGVHTNEFAAKLDLQAAKLIDFSALASDGSGAVKQGLLTAFGGEVPTPAQVEAMWKMPEMLGSGMHSAMDVFTGFSQEQFHAYFLEHPELLNVPMWGEGATFPPPTTGHLAPDTAFTPGKPPYPQATFGSLSDADKIWLQDMTGVPQPTATDLNEAYLQGKIEATVVKALTGYMPGEISSYVGTAGIMTQPLWATGVVPVVTFPNPNYIYAATKIGTEIQHLLATTLGEIPNASNLLHLYTAGTLQGLVNHGGMMLPVDHNTGHPMTLAVWIKAVTGYTPAQIAGSPGDPWTLKPL